MKKLIEINEYEHKGVKVVVKINHMTGFVSILEDGNSCTHKKWLFAERGLEYMQGWQNILDAMKYAVGEATKLLEHDLAEESKFKSEIKWEDKKLPMRKKKK